MEPELFEPIIPDDSYVVENIYNPETDQWEVVSEGYVVGVFETEEQGSLCAANTHLAFETGLINGLLIGYNSAAAAKEALEKRGIRFENQIMY